MATKDSDCSEAEIFTCLIDGWARFLLIFEHFKRMVAEWWWCFSISSYHDDEKSFLELAIAPCKVIFGNTHPHTCLHSEMMHFLLYDAAGWCWACCFSWEMAGPSSASLQDWKQRIQTFIGSVSAVINHWQWLIFLYLSVQGFTKQCVVSITPGLTLSGCWWIFF